MSFGPRLAGVTALLVTVALWHPACAQQPPPTFAQMLRAVPMPVSAERSLAAFPMLAFTRLDLLAGQPGPAPSAGATRLERLGDKPLTALAAAGLLQALPLSALWPETVGFDLDSVDAVLAAPAAGGELPSSTLLVLAGAPRLHEAARLHDALAARGFVRDDLGATTVMRLGDDNSIGPRRRTRGDPFGTGLGMAQRIAVTPSGLLQASETSVIRRALDTAAARSPSLADIAGMQAVLAGLTGTQVVQAIVLSPLAGTGGRMAPAGPSGPAPARPGPGGPALPRWNLAALAQGNGPDGRTHYLAVLVLPDPDQARSVLRARIEAATTGDRPLPIASLDVRALPARFSGLGVLVATMQLAPGADAVASPLSRWWTDMKLGITTPLTFGEAGADRRL